MIMHVAGAFVLGLGMGRSTVDQLLHPKPPAKLGVQTPDELKRDINRMFLKGEKSILATLIEVRTDLEKRTDADYSKELEFLRKEETATRARIAILEGKIPPPRKP